MKKIVLISLSFAFLSALFMLLEKEIKQSNLFYLSYILIIPLVLTVFILFLKREDPKVIKYLTLALSVYVVLSSISEAIILQFWNVYTTPAGDTYTKYDLDGVFIPLGLLVILIIFFFTFCGWSGIKIYRKLRHTN